MKILIVCSTSFYNKINLVKEELENKNYEIILPNSYDETVTNHDYSFMSEEEYNAFFKEMYHLSRNKINSVDAILVLNFDKEKNGVTYKNYIGASTFLEMYEAFMQNKKIYMFNDFPDNMLYDEIKGFNLIILYGNIDKIEMK